MRPRPIHLKYTLKWNPFHSDIPDDQIRVGRRLERFTEQIRDLVHDGGFALIQGQNGTGKSMALRHIADVLREDRDNEVVVLSRPQSSVADFYREMGENFGIDVRASNRWGGFRLLRERWRSKLETTRRRPVLLIDEAQMMQVAVLRELQILVSDRLDSSKLLTVVLCGDQQLLALFEEPDLAPIVSRVRHRLELRALDNEELISEISSLIESAGQPDLMTTEVLRKLAEQSMGNWRSLTQIANELLLYGGNNNLPRIDEKAWIELYGDQQSQVGSRRRGATKGTSRA